MNIILCQKTLSRKAGFFQCASRAVIFRITRRPNTRNPWLGEGPLSHSIDRFGHQPLPPPRPCQNKSEIEPAIFSAGTNAADYFLGVVKKEKPAKLSLSLPTCEKALDNDVRFGGIGVWTRGHIASDRRILRIITNIRGASSYCGLRRNNGGVWSESGAVIRETSVEHHLTRTRSATAGESERDLQ